MSGERRPRCAAMYRDINGVVHRCQLRTSAHAAHEAGAISWLDASDAEYRQCDYCDKHVDRDEMHRVRTISPEDFELVCDDCVEGFRGAGY